MPFPPTPAVVLAPIIKIFPNATQQEVAIILGAIGVGLTFLLLSRFTKLKSAVLLSIFLAFGTVYFWAAVVGTTWYFAHVVAFMFLTLSLIFFFAKKEILAGIFFTLAVTSRLPVFAGIVFFIFELFNDKKRLIKFLSTALLSIPILLAYNFVRFGNFLETGYVEVYKNYVASSYPFTIMQLIKPGFPYFGYLDPRNIPLHIFTFLGFPPIISKSLAVSPSPYGMGILFTSPLLFLAFKINLKEKLERNLLLGATGIALIDFLHYMQGWVQFGYRFALDFLPFLLILLALKFKIRFLTIILLVVSIVVSSWGVIQAINLGW